MEILPDDYSTDEILRKWKAEATSKQARHTRQSFLNYLKKKELFPLKCLNSTKDPKNPTEESAHIQDLARSRVFKIYVNTIKNDPSIDEESKPIYLSTLENLRRFIVKKPCVPMGPYRGQRKCGLSRIINPTYIRRGLKAICAQNNFLPDRLPKRV